MLSNQDWHPQYADKMILELSYLHSGICYAAKAAFFILKRGPAGSYQI